MLKDSKAFHSFSVDDIAAAKRFYGEVLGLDVAGRPEGLGVTLEGGGRLFLYPKGEDHRPASFTVLNFSVDDVAEAVDWLRERGVSFERYDGFEQDERGIATGPGPRIAWFEDPAGNVLSVLEA